MRRIESHFLWFRKYFHLLYFARREPGEQFRKCASEASDVKSYQIASKGILLA